jgi:hypothetical protein
MSRYSHDEQVTQGLAMAQAGALASELDAMCDHILSSANPMLTPSTLRMSAAALRGFAELPVEGNPS